MLLIQMYPRAATWGHNDLALAYNHDRAIRPGRRRKPARPSASTPILPPRTGPLGWALLAPQSFCRSQRYPSARRFSRRSIHVQSPLLLYKIAFIEGDTAGMQRQIDWARGKPDEYVRSTGKPARRPSRDNGARRRNSRAARLIWLRAARRRKWPHAMRRSRRCGALSSEIAGGPKRTRRQGLKLARGRASLPRAALALALCGEANQAKLLIDELSKRLPGRHRDQLDLAARDPRGDGVAARRCGTGDRAAANSIPLRSRRRILAAVPARSGVSETWAGCGSRRGVSKDSRSPGSRRRSRCSIPSRISGRRGRRPWAAMRLGAGGRTRISSGCGRTPTLTCRR